VNLGSRMMRVYFNYVYNQVYDFITARFNHYRELQERCIAKLDLEDNDRVLCVGLGTGNEISHILKMNKSVSIVGVDYSHIALQRAYRKALALGKRIEVLTMDARNLEFAAGNFDKVICLHVMDFVAENEEVTGEIIRVLEDGGQFVITYPSGKEGVRWGLNMLKDNVNRNIRSGMNRARAFLEPLAQVLAGIAYLPLLLRPKKRNYSLQDLEAMVTHFTIGDFHIEEDSVYQDFILYGRK
jgi:ubiquinone/menaquinone biosynthesis C-methylase UbiE